MNLPRICTVTVGGASFKTKLLHNYKRTQPLLRVGDIKLTNHATVNVVRDNTYEVTMDDGEFGVVYRDREGRLIGNCYMVEAVIDAEQKVWNEIKIGVRW